MVFSDSLEVAVGLTFVFLLFSLVLSAVAEAIEAVLKTRGERLFVGIAELLDDARARTIRDATAPASGQAAARALYRHPLIQGLMRGGVDQRHRNSPPPFLPGANRRLPSYLPSRNFALALVDQTLAGALTPAALAAVAGEPTPAWRTASLPAYASATERLALAAEGIENAHLRDVMRQAVAVGRGDMERTRAYLEAWYDGAMDRVSGWYKRHTQRTLFMLGLFVAVAMNVNTMAIVDGLAKNAALRRAIVAQAEAAAHRPAPARADDAVAAIDRTGLPVGWSESGQAALWKPLAWSASGKGWLTGWPAALGWTQILLGWLVTAFAVTLGAPFWFDLLNRLMVIRATVKPTEKSQDEAPQDPQKRAGPGTVVLMQEGFAATPEAAAPRAIDSDIYNDPPTAADRQFEDDEPVGEAA